MSVSRERNMLSKSFCSTGAMIADHAMPANNRMLLWRRNLRG